MRPGQGAAEHGEILGEDIDGAAVDGAPAGDDPVAGDLLVGHAELVGAMFDEHVELLEAALVQQEVDPLPGGQLALGVLRGDAALAAAQLGLSATAGQFIEDMLHAGLPNLSLNHCVRRASGP